MNMLQSTGWRLWSATWRRPSVGGGRHELFAQQDIGLMAIRCKSSRVQTVVHVIAPAFANHQVDSPQDAEVLGNSRLRDAQVGSEGVHAQRVSRL
jgi:hypothetical protein